ncbi:methyltransferase domain-containing protein [Arthrobacter oryzae]|uniref:Methyltransferase domain-containing protein n=1 Tax=Arthrobacter oryzae TaxID=409290 RepID=A0A3N0C788_9MICC|nr:methyltransferase domain-containing protein [Arthrobacter oryzae]RNL58776.1 methyltransferase domain-containing protein [Arthrobacter oryzae]
MTATGLAPAAHFGQGSREPYARALQAGTGTLTLRPESEISAAPPVHFQVRDWCAEASLLERSLLRSLQGPLLDVGCGPGRLLAASGAMGLTALGIDTSAEAVRWALNRGARALEQSIFAPVPQTGTWQSVVVLDGNIGIGGSVTALLRRCRQLIAPTGTLLVEVDPDQDLDTAYSAVLEDDTGNLSEPFRWARTGTAGLAERARRSGWTVASVQHLQGRIFCRLSPAAEAGRIAKPFGSGTDAS